MEDQARCGLKYKHHTAAVSGAGWLGFTCSQWTAASSYQSPDPPRIHCWIVPTPHLLPNNVSTNAPYQDELELGYNRTDLKVLFRRLLAALKISVWNRCFGIVWWSRKAVFNYENDLRNVYMIFDMGFPLRQPNAQSQMLRLDFFKKKACKLNLLENTKMYVCMRW